ncbi:serine/threonine-protein kinase [Parasphingorhabdus pacifica]
MPTPPEDDAPTGSTRLIADRYRLDHEIGGGAMGTVWAGTDELLRRQVAVKEVRLPPGMPEGEAAELRERALREARAIAVVSHPNVVTLYDVARQDGEPYVVMELVPSQSLATILDEHGALAEAQLALIADGVAAALEAAHRAGVVHRDVKPGNVLLGDGGRVKLSDFGISRNLSESTITRTGIMLGTPAFIAPEIASGDPVTAAADLWGLGATLFAAAEGHPPYDIGDDAVATVTSVVHDPVPAPTTTGPVAEVIAGLMVKDPDSRMPLTDVRRRLWSLLPENGSRPFDLLLDPEAATIRVPRPAAAPATPASAAASAASLAADADGSGGAPRDAEAPSPPLAGDPGPLPFTPREPAPRSRGRAQRRLAATATALVAVLLFAAASAGGFVAVRTFAGAALVPSGPERSQPPTPPSMVRWIDDTAHTSDGGGNGRFAITVPAEWTVFHSEREDFTNSKSIHFVAPAGDDEVVVQRFGGFFDDGYDVDDYLDELPELAAGSRGELIMHVERPGSDGAVLRHLAYTTVESGIVASSGPDMRRATVAELLRRGDDLWVVRATVPASEQPRGADLFKAVRPDFIPEV